jgi:hypothetical protein
MRFTRAFWCATIALLAQPQLAAAQGPFGGTGAIASIPGSVVRAGEQPHPVTQPGILSLIGDPTPPTPVADWRRPVPFRSKDPTPSK